MTTRSRFAHPDGPTIAYDDVGDRDAPPVVLLHGASVAASSWFEVVPKLATEYRTLALDHRGHGESDRTPGEYRLEHYAADVEAFIEGVAGEPVALVGHSLGALTANAVVGRRPDLVRCAYLVDPGLYFDAERSMAWRQSRGGAFWPMLPRLLRYLQRCGASIDDFEAVIGALPDPFGLESMAVRFGRDGMRVMAEAASRFDPDVVTPIVDGTFFAGHDTIRPIRCPVRVARADPSLGGGFHPEDEERFLATHPHGSVAYFAGASHLIHHDQPDRFVTDLLTFLAG